MTDRNQKKPSKRPSARRTIPPAKPGSEVPVSEPPPLRSDLPPAPEEKKTRPRKAKKRVAGRRTLPPPGSVVEEPAAADRSRKDKEPIKPKPAKRRRRKAAGEAKKQAKKGTSKEQKKETKKEKRPRSEKRQVVRDTARAIEPDSDAMRANREGAAIDAAFPGPGMEAAGEIGQVDDFGLDPAYLSRVMPLFEFFYTDYFRVQTGGLGNIPSRGRVLLVCNHSGLLPWDGVILKTAFELERPAGRQDLRWLVEDTIFHAPFLGSFINRIGAVRACQENAERLLRRESLLAVFPEGARGTGKLYANRYHLERFGRGGYIKLALRTGAPLLPVAIVGAEEAYPLLYKAKAFSRLLGVPFVPITPLFPWLGPLGLIPLPGKWHISVGEPVKELQGHGPDAAEDPSLVNRLNERVRLIVQNLVDRTLSERGT